MRDTGMSKWLISWLFGQEVDSLLKRQENWILLLVSINAHIYCLGRVEGIWSRWKNRLYSLGDAYVQGKHCLKREKSLWTGLGIWSYLSFKSRYMHLALGMYCFTWLRIFQYPVYFFLQVLSMFSSARSQQKAFSFIQRSQSLQFSVGLFQSLAVWLLVTMTHENNEQS